MSSQSLPYSFKDHNKQGLHKTIQSENKDVDIMLHVYYYKVHLIKVIPSVADASSIMCPVSLK